MLTTTFDITPDRSFLQHFLTRWRTLSISPEMVEKLMKNSSTNPYAAYGYGRWLSQVNPGGNSLQEAETLLTWAGSQGVQDANAALAQMYHDGLTKEDEAMPWKHAKLMEAAYKAGSELAQYNVLLNTIYGDYGYSKNPAMVADILQNHLEKNPGSDTIYYSLLGEALEDTDPAEAEKNYRIAIGREDPEAYFGLAETYRQSGDWAKACKVAEEGARNGAVNCRRYKALMEQEDFLKLPEKEQEALHKDLAEGLDYAISRHDRFACYLKGMMLYFGYLGFPEDPEAALVPLTRGAEMGEHNSLWLKAVILKENNMASASEIAKTCLQALRLGNRENFTLEKVAGAYVAEALPKHQKEIETLWLKEYVAQNPEEEDSKDTLGVLSVYPRGFYYAMDVEGADKLDLESLASQIDAGGFDIVHFSPVLTRITKALGWDKEGVHVAMLVDKDGFMKDLPDNMAATIIYGHGQEIRGTVAFALEDDKTYRLMPMKGLQRVFMFIRMLTAGTMGLVREPTSEELESIGAEDPGGFEEYDDPDIFGEETKQEIEEDMVSADTSEEHEPMELTVPLDRLEEGFSQCNLCQDTLTVILPNSREYWFKSAEELIFDLGIKADIEENIERHGGYMIDEWQYVDARQVPMDIRSRIRFKQKD